MGKGKRHGAKKYEQYYGQPYTPKVNKCTTCRTEKDAETQPCFQAPYCTWRSKVG